MKIIAGLGLLLLVSCGNNYEVIQRIPIPINGKDGLVSLISTEKIETNTCTSGQGTLLNTGLDLNQNGTLDTDEITDTDTICEGATGDKGESGLTSLINVLDEAPSCPNGGITIITGLDTNRDGKLTSLDGTLMSSTICNGVDGQDGKDGQDGQDGKDAYQSPLQLMQTIAPCGNTVAYKEQLLCLANGSLLASFSENENGKNTRISFITEGTFMNTDGSKCIFTVSKQPDNSMLVTWSNGYSLCKAYQ